MRLCMQQAPLHKDHITPINAQRSQMTCLKPQDIMSPQGAMSITHATNDRMLNELAFRILRRRSLSHVATM